MDDEFDDFDNDGLLEAPSDDDEPSFRATIVGNRLRLVCWTGYLAHGGPLGGIARSRGEDAVTIADLTVVLGSDSQRELIVEPIAEGPDPELAEEVLIEWARTVGYARIWLAGRVVDLEPPAQPLGQASIDCPTCHVHWSDGTPAFWAEVFRCGSFPRWCMVCGGDLPQWRVRSRRQRPPIRTRASGRRAHSAPDSPRRSGRRPGRPT
jgi:hypothetical protein